MNKKKVIAIIKPVMGLALAIMAIVAIIVALGASVAWITGWGLAKGTVAVLLGAIVSVGSQAAVKDM